MISFLIPLKDDPDIDFSTLEMQVLSCLRVAGAHVEVGLSEDDNGHLASWHAHPLFQHSRVCLSVTQDCGLYEGWNKLVARTDMPWVCFLGFGDFVLAPEHYERCLARSGAHNAHFSKVVVFGGHKSRLFGRPFRPWRHRIKQEAAHAGAIFKRQLFVDAPYDESYRVAGDYEWLLRNAAQLTPSFEPITAVAMPAGGMSEKLVSLTRAEIKRAKKKTNAA